MVGFGQVKIRKNGLSAKKDLSAGFILFSRRDRWVRRGFKQIFSAYSVYVREILQTENSCLQTGREKEESEMSA